jgi:hypothetical protein
VTGCCEHGNEPSCSVKAESFLTSLMTVSLSKTLLNAFRKVFIGFAVPVLRTCVLFQVLYESHFISFEFLNFWLAISLSLAGQKFMGGRVGFFSSM